MSAYLGWIKAQRCARCTAAGVDVAHIGGLASRKTGLPLPRRRGIAFVWAIPLCKECHQTGRDSIHAVGEAAFFEAFGRGEAYGLRLAGSYLAAYVSAMEGRAHA